MAHEVKMVREGRGGWVYYREGVHTLRFEWDVTSIGFEIYTRPPDAWAEFCTSHQAPECIDRREEILARVVEAISRKQGKNAEVTRDDRGISFSFEHNWLHRFLNRILGV